MDMYTPSGGNTPQALATNNLSSALSSIQGMSPVAAQAIQMQANAPQFQQQTTQANQQQAGLPVQTQNYANEANLLTMFAHDQNLAQQYTRPDMQVLGASTQQGSDVPTFGNVGVPQTPVLTLNSLNQPFSGFTTPGAINTAISNQGSQYQNALDLISKAIQFNSGQVASNVNQNTSNYAAATNALTSLANLLAAQQSSSSSLYGAGGSLNSGNLLDQVYNDVANIAAGEGRDATASDVWNYINMHQPAWEAQGVDVNQIWSLFRQKFPEGGDPNQTIFAGTKTPAAIGKNALGSITVAPNRGILSDIGLLPGGAMWKPKGGTERKIPSVQRTNPDGTTSEVIRLHAPDGSQVVEITTDDPNLQNYIDQGYTPEL